MQNSFFQAICRVGIFMICAHAIIHFRPQEAYEKYLKLLVSLMVLIQLFLPLGSFLLEGGSQEAAKLLEELKQELEQGMKEARESAAEADAILGQMTLEEVRKRLEESGDWENEGEADSGNWNTRQNMETENTEKKDIQAAESKETEDKETENKKAENQERGDTKIESAEAENIQTEGVNVIEVEPVDPINITE